MRAGALLGVGLALAACRPAGAPVLPHGPQTLGGREVSAELLRVGQDGYTQYCRACHGDRGDGRGPSSEGMRPPPRDLTRGAFKFGSTLPRDDAPTLPTDADLERIVRSGLSGTAMLAWDVPQPQLDAIVQYTKTFSPRWASETPGDPLVPSADPFAGADVAGVELGRKLYHSVAQCSSCHPAYATRDEVASFSRELNPSAPVELRPDAQTAVPTDSTEYSIDRVHPLRIIPPDFLHRPLRSVRPDRPVADLYRVIALGINGAAMPAWRDSLTEAQLWALSHYVASLVALRDTPQGEAVWRHLVVQSVDAKAPSRVVNP